MPPTSTLAAIRTGLTEWLSDESGIQWDYYKSYVLPSDGAKGAVFVQRSQSLPGFNYLPTQHDAILQLLIADNDHQVAQNLSLDWGEHLTKTIETLSRQGITGLHRGIQLNRACMGIKISESGISYFVQDSSQRQDIPEGIALATIQLNCTFKVEGKVQLY